VTTTPQRRRGAPPVYRQVETELRRRIRDGELAPGERLPTEAELAQQWGVNRLTIRQAIGELARAGHVTVRQGSGTYVALPPMVFDLGLPLMPSTDADAGSTAAVAGHVQHDQTEVLVAVTEPDADPVAAAALGTTDALVRVDTLVRTGDQPFLLSSYWLPAGRFAGISAHLADRIALFAILRDHYGRHLRHSWRSLVATVADREDAALLDIPPGAPVMLREGVNVDADLVPTMYLRRRIRGDRIKFTMHYDTASGETTPPGG
jgi:GntR family transcriptional regulator